MSEFGQTLLGTVSQDFQKKMKSDRKIKRLAKRIRDGTVYYEGANEYSVRVGELLSESLLENTETLAFMSEEVANDLLYPLLTADHEILSEIVKQVQTNMIEANDLGLSALMPDLDTNRIDGLVEKIASYASFDEARYLLGEPIINYSQAVVDEGMRKNAEATSRLGMRSIIRRKTAPSEVSRGDKIVRSKKGKVYRYPYARYGNMYRFPCSYCSNLEGVYDYESLKRGDNSIYRRHEHCRCTMTYEIGNRRQDVWSKAEWTSDDADAQRQAIEAVTERRQAEARAKETERKSRLNNMEYFMTHTGYSAKSASKLINKYKNEVAEFGIDWLVDLIGRK